MAPTDSSVAPSADAVAPRGDDTLTLLFMCCHPAVSPPSQVALTLRAVGGLTTAEIAAAFLVPEATMAQRIVRAKQRIKSTGIRFQLPPPSEWDDRLGAVLHVLYLVFNEGYTASSGHDLNRTELTNEAIRLTRSVHRLLPDDGEVAGTARAHAAHRRPTPGPDRARWRLIPLAEQDRSVWQAASIEEGLALIARTLAQGPVGPYQIQAAIAAVHAEARGPRTPTGRRSWRCTTCCGGPRRTPWSRSTTPSPSRWLGPRGRSATARPTVDG